MATKIYKIEDTITGKVFKIEGEEGRPPTEDEIPGIIYGEVRNPRPTDSAQLGPLKVPVPVAKAAEAAVKFKDEVIAPMPVEATLFTLEQLDRPYGAMRAMAMGESPVQGFINPENYQQKVGMSALKAWGMIGKVPDNVAAVIGTTVDMFTDIGLSHLLFNVGPRDIKNASKSLIEGYSKKQGTSLDRLKFALADEIQATGQSQTNALGIANTLVNASLKKTNVFQRTPSAINETTRYLNSHKGELGKNLSILMDNVKTRAAGDKFTGEWMKKAMSVIERDEASGRKLITFPRVAPGGKSVIRLSAPPASAASSKVENVGKALVPVAKPAPIETKEEFVARLRKIVDERANAREVGPQKDVLPIGGKPSLSPFNKVSLAPDKEVIKKAHATTLERKNPSKLVVAARVDGKVIVGKPGEIHAQMGLPSTAELGFADNKGNFLTREEAAKTISTRNIDAIINKRAAPKVKKITVDNLIDDPDLADEVMKNPSAHHPDVVNLAKQINEDTATESMERLVKPEELQAKPDLADSVISRPAKQSPETIAAAKEIKAEPVPEIQSPKNLQVEKIDGRFDINTTYNVQYHTFGGARDTLMNGSELNAMEASLRAGKKTVDSRGGIVTKVLDAFPIKGERGSVLLPFDEKDFQDFATDLGGDVEKAKAALSKVGKTFGTPFFIGQKYPAFKPVYMAVQDAIDYKNELFAVGAKILDPKRWAKISEASKAKITDVLRLSNSPVVGEETSKLHKWFTDDELIGQYHFNAEEVQAYKAVKRMYQFATNIEVKARKIMMGFDSMTPAQQAKANEAIQKQVAKLDGYVSTSRLTGDWAVYAPPEKEGGAARFFNLYGKKSEAERAAEAIGTQAKVYLRRNVEREVYNNISLSNLESLIEAADVNASADELNALRDVIKKRTFSSHWVKRQYVPGYEWNFDNVLDSAIDYMEGAANKLSRITGRNGAEAAFRTNVSKLSPEMRAYAQDYIKSYYDLGAIGFKGLNRLVYGWKLAFKTSWLAQNLTQPIATTYPALAEHYTGMEVEKTFLNSYDQARRYLAYKMRGDSHGLSTELTHTLDKLQRQGVLGDQMTRFQLGVRTLKGEQFEKAIGLFARGSEAANRTHAAICGYRVATEKLGLKGNEAIMDYVKEFVGKTQFMYGKQNLPKLITGSGNLRNFVRTMYAFRHYNISYLQMLNSMMPWRGAPPRQWTRAIGALTTQAGIKGLPFFGLGALAYKKMMGRTLDNDVREAMEESGLPNKAIDLTLHGAYSTVGVDASNLVGMGDVIPTQGNMMSAVGGPVAGMVGDWAQGVSHIARGEYDRAAEKLTPDALRNLLRAKRYATEGIRKLSGEVINTPSKLDDVLKGLGFTTLTESKGYEAQEAKTTMTETARNKSSFYNQKLAEALVKGDIAGYRKMKSSIHEFNKRVPKEQRISIDREAIRTDKKKMRGKDVGVPRKFRREFKEIDKRYGIQKRR